MFTASTQAILRQATTEADALRHHRIGTEHLLLAIIRYHEKNQDLVPPIGVTHNVVQHKVKNVVGTGITKSHKRFPLTPRAHQVFLLAAGIVVAKGHEQVQPTHLLLAILQEGKGVACQVLKGLGVDMVKLYEKVDLRAAPVPTRIPVQFTMDALVNLLASDASNVEALVDGLAKKIEQLEQDVTSDDELLMRLKYVHGALSIVTVL